MSTQTKWLRLFLTLLIGVIGTFSHALKANESVTLYTPYTKISVPPGESIDYAIDVINNGKEVQTVDISVTGMPFGWNYSLKSGAWTIGQVSILPGERKSLSLKVEVPLQVNKGNYKFNVVSPPNTNLQWQRGRIRHVTLSLLAKKSISATGNTRPSATPMFATNMPHWMAGYFRSTMLLPEAFGHQMAGNAGARASSRSASQVISS